MVYQLIFLNVAVNSYDHALLTLLVSNQFVEIKGSVFKRFEKDNLFQITCAGESLITPRGLSPGLSGTCRRHRGTVYARINVGCCGFPKSYRAQWIRTRSLQWLGSAQELWVVWGQQHPMDHLLCAWKTRVPSVKPLNTYSQPVLTVMCSEMLVDWLKHAFITKFNHIRPSDYERYADVLCRDLTSGSAVGRRGSRKVLIPSDILAVILTHAHFSIRMWTNRPSSPAGLGLPRYHWQCSLSSLCPNRSILCSPITGGYPSLFGAFPRSITLILTPFRSPSEALRLSNTQLWV